MLALVILLLIIHTPTLRVSLQESFPIVTGSNSGVTPMVGETYYFAPCGFSAREVVAVGGA